MVIRLLISVFLLLFLHPSMAIDTLTASVDKNPVLVGEYFTLTIEADGKVSGEQPDTSALSAQFVTGPISVGSRTSIINGSMSSQTTWQMQVLARKPGTFTIPAFEVAGKRSEAIQLKVVPRGDEQQQQKDIFVTAELTPSNLYVQQAGLYTVKLYLGKDLLDGQLSAPQMSDAQISQMGKQQEDYEVVDGRRYMVITREYLIQPQKSGDYTITAPVFNGQVRENYRRMAVSAIAEDTQLEVKPIPDTYQGAWLPSELVNLSEEWQPADESVTVGTPITRTITLTALGVTQEQLPDIELDTISGIRSYPDESDRNQLSRDGRVISQLVSSHALVPQKPGTYTLPEVKIPWFNTVINKVNYATLPARTITVTADPNQPLAPITAPVSPIAPENPQGNTEQPNQRAQSLPVNTPVETASKTLIDWIVMGAGYVLWLLTLAIWWFKKPQAPQPKTSAKAPDSMIALKAAAKQHNAHEFYQALRALAKKQAPTLGFDAWLAQLNSPELSDEIAKLQASLYSESTHSADLTQIYQLLQTAIKKHAAQDSAHLTQLY
ncbi:BatD family protein [Pseudoalteromonas sp. MMG022]|uniref:BatD family protein n=1 Tax=Pseudoalteromonas sp. MMG022 TaxID=2909978 RepID=UPI001F19797E|nr:BatD family protein [Pseudoalteromonas sp. MMG022]MCF6434771.1 BatD family protein [Pseudoalteromonas sp. MMG022]